MNALDFWRQPLEPRAKLATLPKEPSALAKAIQGLLIHEHMGGMYGVEFTPAQHAEAHVRPIAQTIDAILSQDPRPLTEARSAGQRYVCVCRTFALLFVAAMRAHGTPARARCGFGMYFEKVRGYDHWVGEYWNGARWVMVDAQIDDTQRKTFGIEIDTLDVRRDQFLVAGDAWRLCRAGKMDPMNFGILDMWGDWFIASNLIRDVASLNNREMLPWDVWGEMTQDNDKLDHAFLDRLAGLTHDPDRHFDELRAAYKDPRLSVPTTVFNAVLNRPEAA
jgi:hypothetical protein